MSSSNVLLPCFDIIRTEKDRNSLHTSPDTLRWSSSIISISVIMRDALMTSERWKRAGSSTPSLRILTRGASSQAQLRTGRNALELRQNGGKCSQFLVEVERKCFEFSWTIINMYLSTYKGRHDYMMC